MGWNGEGEFLKDFPAALGMAGAIIGVALSPLITRGLSAVAIVVVENSITISAIAGVALAAAIYSNRKSV